MTCTFLTNFLTRKTKDEKSEKKKNSAKRVDIIIHPHRPHVIAIRSVNFFLSRHSPKRPEH